MEDGTKDDPNGIAAISDDSTGFGSCCEELGEALGADGFDPLMTVGEDGILYLSVGEVEMQDDQRSFVDHPIFFCPFCGSKLQTREEVMAKLNVDDGAAEGN